MPRIKQGHLMILSAGIILQSGFSFLQPPDRVFKHEHIQLSDKIGLHGLIGLFPLKRVYRYEMHQFVRQARLVGDNRTGEGMPEQLIGRPDYPHGQIPSISQYHAAAPLPPPNPG